MSNRVVLVVSIIALVLGVAALAVAVSGQRQDTPAPDKSDPAAYTVAFVQDAIDRYERDGRDAAIAYYNTRDGIDGQWYVFIIGENDRTIGHYNPAIRDRDPSERVDVTGYYYGPEMLAADEEGRWVTYVFYNPDTNRQDLKHAWVVKHDGLLFGSGWYERLVSPRPDKSDPAAYTVAFVRDAVGRYQREGREAAFAYFDSAENQDGQWYAYVLEDGYIAAHPRPELRGDDVAALTDITGYNFGPDLLAVDEDGRWVTYVFLNIASGQQELKHSWTVEYDGLLFGSGWYERHAGGASGG